MIFRPGRFLVIFIHLSCTHFQEATGECSPIKPRSRSGKGKDWAEGAPGLPGGPTAGSEVPQAGSRPRETGLPRKAFPAGPQDRCSWGRRGDVRVGSRGQGTEPNAVNRPSVPPPPGAGAARARVRNSGCCRKHGHAEKTPALTGPTVLRSRGGKTKPQPPTGDVTTRHTEEPRGAQRAGRGEPTPA